MISKDLDVKKVIIFHQSLISCSKNVTANCNLFRKKDLEFRAKYFQSTFLSVKKKKN